MAALSKSMRVWHRYLGFFLAGIMAVYAISGIVLIFRNKDFLKQEKTITKTLKPGLSPEEIGKETRIKELKIESERGDLQLFKQGSYNQRTGELIYTIKSLPLLLDKLTKLHKANSGQPLFYLNVFFGLSLLFFVVSSFWMFLPKTTIFKRGIYFALAGLLLTLLLLFI